VLYRVRRRVFPISPLSRIRILTSLGGVSGGKTAMQIKSSTQNTPVTQLQKHHMVDVLITTHVHHHHHRAAYSTVLLPLTPSPSKPLFPFSLLYSRPISLLRSTSLPSRSCSCSFSSGFVFSTRHAAQAPNAASRRPRAGNLQPSCRQPCTAR
jgi:hypothetical protein